ncbi:HlyD family secretion protein [Sphingomonas psychrotolerans]|uniref:HlyD family secretion protein n=1 Tax=Sphingomonas psychrotolerans TaxID=1327635 RepID=A0ABU3N6H7_9SPHN|nr:HlyD family secretion protein [Sphingomonas psychrotolerans]MDT8760140.1 HlyD family secretion protein [Sphingomonas psychrotolerans]
MADRNPPPVEAAPVAASPATTEGADPPPAPEARRWNPPRPKPFAIMVLVLILVAGIVAILAAWRIGPFAGTTQSTENAFVRGQVTIVSPQVSGYVTEVPVQDFATVQAGDVLARIDDRIYRQRVEQARANVANAHASLANNPQQVASRAASLGSQQAGVEAARAQLVRAQADNARIEELARQGFVANRERDASRAALRQAQADLRQAEAARTIAQEDIRSVAIGRGGLEAGVEAAQAALRLAEIDLANTVIRAPVAGQLGEIGVRRGQYVTAGTQLMSLVPHQLWVIANFKEAQTAKIRPGAIARFKVDALGGERLTGRVEQLAPAAGSEFAVIRPDNASGNFVKVPQRIAVRIRIDPDQPAAARLRPGMSVEAEVELAE